MENSTYDFELTSQSVNNIVHNTYYYYGTNNTMLFALLGMLVVAVLGLGVGFFCYKMKGRKVYVKKNTIGKGVKDTEKDYRKNIKGREIEDLEDLYIEDDYCQDFEQDDQCVVDIEAGRVVYIKSHERPLPQLPEQGEEAVQGAELSEQGEEAVQGAEPIYYTVDPELE